MAFLDNSGDIILDAVLTDRGRRLMAGGSGLTITKFALGDDEINYGSYDKGHPSGSAYYDLEVLQTPVFESATQINANINYGLLTFSNPNILYMPSFVQNQKDNGAGFASTHQKLYYIAVNTETVDAMLKSAYLFADNHEKIIQAGSTTHRAIAYELGINSSEIAKNQQTKIQYIQNMGIRDQNYIVSVNNLFIGGVMSLMSKAPSYTNDLNDNKLASFPSPKNLGFSARAMGSKNRLGHIDYACRGSAVNIYEPNNASSTASTYSVISGPSNSIVLLNVAVQAGLDHSKAGVRDRKYAEYGKTSQTAQQAFGAAGSDGNTYDYIDTTVYLQANTSGAQISIPVRLIRRAS
mgnify:CR=1 FL=1